MIYLRFLTEQWSLESRLIRFGTRWWPSHVEFVDLGVGGEVPVRTLGSRLQGGVQFRTYGYCKPTREEWWSAPGIDAAYETAKACIGCRYDWQDILGFVLVRSWHRPGSYICSELVDAAFKNSGNPLTNVWMPSSRVSPRDLLVSPALQFVKRVV